MSISLCCRLTFNADTDEHNSPADEERPVIISAHSMFRLVGETWGGYEAT